MSLAFDESGRPFIILREQSKKKRVKGLDAHKVSLQQFLEIIKKCSIRISLLIFLLKIDQYFSRYNCSQSP